MVEKTTPSQVPFLMTSRTRSQTAKELPRQVYIEITNYCNSRCVSCPLTYDHLLADEPKHHLGWEEFLRITDQLPLIDRAVLHGKGSISLAVPVLRGKVESVTGLNFD